MTNDQQLTDTSDQAYQQALIYGRDLARIYVVERAKSDKLEAAYQLLNTVFDSTPDGLIVLDKALVVQRANAAFERLAEIKAVGMLIGTILSIDELAPAFQLPESALSMQVEVTLLVPYKRLLLVGVARLRAGSLQGWILTLHDQTEHKRLDYQKREFINIAAHELRTPLAGILGYADILRTDLDGKIDETQSMYLESLWNAGQRLNWIVNELIQFAELNSSHMQQDGVSTFKLSVLIDELIAEEQYRIEEQQLTVRKDVADVELVCDRALLRSALFQLLSNAIKFNTLAGTIRIQVSQETDIVYICVSDSGIGIAQNELETIFQPFFQIEDHQIRSQGGLGLGLCIAQRAIVQLSGTLTVKSVLGQGTIINLSLPQNLGAASKSQALEVQLETTQQQSLAYARDLQTLYRQFQQINNELKEVNVQLDEANTLKSNFLGVISHELRSPFASIDMALQVFARYGTEHLLPPQRELLEQLNNSFPQARQMIDNLVAYAGLLSKQGRLNLDVIDLNSLINETAVSLQPKAKVRGIRWEVQIPTDVILVSADRVRISEAIWHLMLNAIKFNKPHGEVITRVYYQDKYVVIEVKDSGVGIAADKQAIIGRPFEQIADPLKRGMEGLGLGLALVRYVAVAHGGQITFQSELGVGSTFMLWLPVSLQGRLR